MKISFVLDNCPVAVEIGAGDRFFREQYSILMACDCLHVTVIAPEATQFGISNSLPSLLTSNPLHIDLQYTLEQSSSFQSNHIVSKYPKFHVINFCVCFRVGIT